MAYSSGGYSSSGWDSELEDGFDFHGRGLETVNSYVMGKTVGRGTFGKVKEGKHILTGDKVQNNLFQGFVERYHPVFSAPRVAGTSISCYFPSGGDKNYRKEFSSGKGVPCDGVDA
jgi:hypothetical protein